jgi:YegS/Rv2252/BmrU family lipid kinase
MQPLVIVNPRSQSGKTGTQASEIVGVIERYVGAVDRADTSGPRHAAELAEQAANEGREAVIAVGGDGTVHEVANGLMRARAAGKKPPRLGIVGQGTGGDFRKTLGLEHRLDRYCQAIAGARTRNVDVGSFRYRNNNGDEDQAFFINILSMGMGGLVDRYVADSNNQLGGTLTYLSASVRALFDSEIGILDCVRHRGSERIEEEIQTRMLAVCNGRYFGSGMQIAPMAELDDGIFHVVSLGGAPKLKFALGSLRVYNGSHIGQPDVEVSTCERIDISLRNDGIRDRFLLDVDGEPLGTLPVSIEVIPAALEIFVA